MRRAAFNQQDLIDQYISLLKRLNGTQDFHYCDLYMRNNKLKKTFSIDETVQIALGATKSFGPFYKEQLLKLFDDSTFHLGNEPEKRAMWAIYPPVGNAKAYTILKYNGSFLSSNVLLRAIVGNLAQYHYIPDTRDDPPVFNNSVIYVGSLLHTNYLIDQARNDAEKIFYIREELSRLWNSFFKYCIYAEFENQVEKRLIQGLNPNGQEISEIYLKVLHSFFGNGIKIPEYYQYEWMTIAQPFSTYEHQYWPMAMAASCKLVQLLPSTQKVQNLFLGRTNAKSDRSYQILTSVGIEMNNPVVYNSIIERMRSRIGQLNKIMKY